MSRANYLIDSSIAQQTLAPEIGARVLTLQAHRQAWTCPGIDLEFGFSRQSVEEYRDVMTDRAVTYLMADYNMEIDELAARLQRALSDRHMLRSCGPIDILSAATAIHYGLIVLHNDTDFETIARVSYLQQERILILD